MRCIKPFQNSFTGQPGLLVLAAALLWVTAASADRFPPDPVRELRQILRATPEELSYRDPELDRKVKDLKPEERRKVLAKARERKLLEKVDAIRTIPDMRRALVLTDWRVDDPTDEQSLGDREALNRLVERFREAVLAVLKNGTTDARLAAMSMLADAVTSAQSAAPTQTPTTDRTSAARTELRRGLGRSFTKELVELAKNSDARIVRETAARTLGQLFSSPDLSAPVLGKLLASREVGERRAAASGLVGLIRVPFQLTTGAKSGTGPQRVEADRGDIVASGKLVVPAAAPGLSDSDLQVRRLCAEAIQQSAAALINQVPQLRVEDISGALDIKAEDFQLARDQLMPLMQAFADQAPALVRALNDRDPEVRLLVRRAVEDLGYTRQRFQKAAEVLTPGAGAPTGSEESDRGSVSAPVTRVASGQPPAERPADPLRKGLEQAVPELAAGLKDPLSEIRLRTVDVLESMGPLATPAIPALTKATRDPDLFVRWAAARTIGKIGAVQTELTVPALARLLRDQDLDVNLAAALALRRIGPPAKEAIPALVATLTASDAEKRKSALNALQGIGTDAASAIPAIAGRLTDEDPSKDSGPGVRSLAAEVLGNFGPQAKSAVPALRRALETETNPEVRQAISDALLSVLRTESPK
jgi:HEAT repeat protein